MKALLILGLALLVVGCGPLPTPAGPGAGTGTPAPSGDNPLAGTEWVLTSLYGAAPLESTRITLEFQDDTVGGFAGCNAYGGGPENGGYTHSTDGTLKIPPLARTAMACLEPEGVMDQEDAYLDALAGAATYRITDSRLEIHNESGDTVMVLAQREPVTLNPAELEGTAWQLLTIDGQEPADGSSLTISFHGGGRASGYAGCRDYVTLYQADANRLGFYYTSMMGPLCDDEAQLQLEGSYTTILSWVDRYVLEAGRLELQTVRGETLVYEPLPAEAQRSLEGSSWILISFVEPKPGNDSASPTSVTRDPLAGTEISLTLSDGQVKGSAGCNSYGGSYTLQGESLAIKDLYQTEVACMDPEGVMDQESGYLDLLREATQANVLGGQLWLENGDGRGLVFKPES